MLLTITLLSALHAASPADSLAGVWKFTNEVQGTAWTEVCTFKQTGTALGGSCMSEAGEAHAITGELKAGKLAFQHTADYQGQEITIIFTGEVESGGQLKKGDIFVKPLDASGSFTAAPAAAAK